MQQHRSRFAVALVLAAALGAALIHTGCSSDGANAVIGARSNVRVVLSADSFSPLAAGAPETSALGGSGSAPGSLGTTGDDHHDHGLKSAEVVLSDVKARSVTLQQLVDVQIDLPATVDLLALMQNGGQVDLGMGFLPPDSYDQMVVVISSLNLTAMDDTRITITPPGGGWTSLVAVDPFEVVEGETTLIQLRLRVSSFKFRLDGDMHDIDHDDFDPDFDVEVDD